jgi:hypothetical protein
MITNFFKPVAGTAARGTAAPVIDSLAASPLANPSPAPPPAPAAAHSGVKRKAPAAGPSDAELKHAKQVVAAANKAKKAKAEAAFVCSEQLLGWAISGSLHGKLLALTTNFLKGHCQDNGLLYGGAKYKLVQRLAEHAEEGVRRAKWSAARAAAEAGDTSAAAEALFFKVKSFSASLNLFRKQHELLMGGKKRPVAVRQRIQSMAGLTTGFDAALLKAITGPDRKKYNGSRGEIGLDGQREVADMWGGFLLDTLKEEPLSCDDWRLACDALWLERPPAAYGFDGYGELVMAGEASRAIEAAVSRSAELKAMWDNPNGN